MSNTIIINTGSSNLRSVSNLIYKLGGKSKVLEKNSELASASRLILPGVGSFDYAVNYLKSNGFYDDLKYIITERKVPVLGICLGMQLLCRGSEEGELPGLGVIEADVKRFNLPQETKIKVPHMGWNVVSTAKVNPILPCVSEEQRFYFVHSYKVVPDNSEIIIGLANHGENFCAAFQKGNVFGVQFHPEKSHRFGAGLMQRFLGL